VRLRELGYEVERGKSGQPEIKGYTQAYLDASSPRSQQIRDHLEQQGLQGAAAAQIAAHQTRDEKLPSFSHDEMRAKHQELAEAFGNQPEHVIRAAHERQSAREWTPDIKVDRIDAALSYSRERNIERQAVVGERELMRDALNRSMGEATLSELRQRFEDHVHSGRFIEAESQSLGRAFTTRQMISYERDNIAIMRSGRNESNSMASPETWREVRERHPHLSPSQSVAVEQILFGKDRIMGLEGVAGAGKTTSLAPSERRPNVRATMSVDWLLRLAPPKSCLNPALNRKHGNGIFAMRINQMSDTSGFTLLTNRASPARSR
jgi:flagellar biosynthesis GTPase FlhF